MTGPACDRPGFEEGDLYSVSGLDFRIRRGRKAVGDIVLDVETQQGWLAVPMALTFFLVDFHCQVEDILYPPGVGRGGGYFMDRLNYVRRHGWRRAADILETEKMLRNVKPPQEQLFP